MQAAFQALRRNFGCSFRGRFLSGLSSIPFDKDSPALIDSGGVSTYSSLLSDSVVLVDHLKLRKDRRVAFLVPPSYDFGRTMFACWFAGATAVPLCVAHPAEELQFVIEDSDADAVVVHKSLSSSFDMLQKKLSSRRFVLLPERQTEVRPIVKLSKLEALQRALIIYTSGTTGKPKGVVSSTEMLNAQIDCLVKSWEWSCTDHILHCLPLHHVHGLVNALLCPLSVGATVEFMPSKFDANRIWDRLESGEPSVFMGVPTMYVKLIEAHTNYTPERKARILEVCKQMRLMVSGSMALPVSVLETWERITGHRLLERYGMTEFGMALSNPLHGLRKPGFVGRPLPGVSVKVVDESGRESEVGELLVKGPNVFSEYWRRPEATKKEFDSEGWFKTGDIVSQEDGDFRIIGRASVDIIKTGGYKVSALEIEAAILEHPDVRECAVVGSADVKWGQRVAAAVVLKDGASLNPELLRSWCKQKLAGYKIPSLYKFIDSIPRNVMGKASKKEVEKLFAQSQQPTENK